MFSVSLCKDCAAHDFDAAPFGPHGPWDECADARAFRLSRSPEDEARDRRALNGAD